MATATASYHGHRQHEDPLFFTETKRFFSDLGEDLKSTLPQMRGQAKTDLFHSHINALAISYFGLIVLLTAASLPALAYLVSY